MDRPDTPTSTENLDDGRSDHPLAAELGLDRCAVGSVGGDWAGVRLEQVQVVGDLEVVPDGVRVSGIADGTSIGSDGARRITGTRTVRFCDHATMEALAPALAHIVANGLSVTVDVAGVLSDTEILHGTLTAAGHTLARVPVEIS